jgi:hypothetical protein
MPAVTFLAALAAIWKVLDLVKFAKAKDVNGALTLLCAMGLGIAAAFLFAQADIADGWDVGTTMPLSQLDGASLVILGLLWGSGASALVSFKQARDNADSATVPKLVNPTPGD